MRDLETMEAAMKLAETGHLTMGTLHTNSAAQTVTRIIDAFPAHQQSQIRTQLSLVLEGIVCQALLPKSSGQGRVAALEILVATPAIRALIRDDKSHQIYGTMQTGQDKFGMQTMNQSLARLVQKRLITRETAASCSSNRDELFQMLERSGQQAGMPPSVAARRMPLGQGVR
jgi:twitching motility protein PilT